MPCYTRETSSVEFGDKTDPKMLQKALQDLGYSVRVMGGVVEFWSATHDGKLSNGTLTINHNGLLDVTAKRNEIARGYSKQVILSAAQRFGWAAKQTADDKLTVTRRI